MCPYDENAVELEEDVLESVAGGTGSETRVSRTVTNLKTGYLAVRSDPSYNDNNILGHLYNGATVISYEQYSKDGKYVWVYASCPEDLVYTKNAYDGEGWVNAGFLSKIGEVK